LAVVATGLSRRPTRLTAAALAAAAWVAEGAAAGLTLIAAGHADAVDADRHQSQQAAAVVGAADLADLPTGLTATLVTHQALVQSSTAGVAGAARLVLFPAPRRLAGARDTVDAHVADEVAEGVAAAGLTRRPAQLTGAHVIHEAADQARIAGVVWAAGQVQNATDLTDAITAD
jgi:hypothetical protein